MNIQDEIKQGEGYVLLSRAAVESCSKTTLETRLVNSMVNSQFGKDKSGKKIQNDTNMSHQRSEIIADEGPCVSQFIYIRKRLQQQQYKPGAIPVDLSVAAKVERREQLTP